MRSAVTRRCHVAIPAASRVTQPRLPTDWPPCAGSHAAARSVLTVWSEAISLPCGHQVRGRCGGPPLCEAPVPASGSRDCGHSATVPCHLSASGGALALDARCDMSCAAQLLCGHQCPAPCWGCDSGLHPPCVQPCPRPLVCGHPCPGLCGEFCPPCTKRCLLTCPHGQCKVNT